jgi:hypothetical protein
MYFTVNTTSHTLVDRVEPDDWILHYTSELFVSDTDDDPSPPVRLASLTWRRLLLGLALDEGQDRYEIFDAADADLEALYSALYDDDGELRPTLNTDTAGDLAYLDRFTLEPGIPDSLPVADLLLHHVVHALAAGVSSVAAFKGRADPQLFSQALSSLGFDLLQVDTVPLWYFSPEWKSPPLTALEELEEAPFLQSLLRSHKPPASR